MSTYSIKDLENLSGIKAHTLRIWEQRYDVITPKRTDTNIRYYSSDDLKLLLNIALLNNNGYKISKISKMSHAEIAELAYKLCETSTEADNHLSLLTSSMVELDEEKFEKVLSTSILQNGFEKTIIKVIQPFLQKIGILWQTGNINPAQEHFITNLIRQKVIVAIDGQVTPEFNENKKKFLLYLPEGEFHELSLLFSSYLLKSRGHKVIYLGTSVPLKDVQSVFGYHEADYVLTIFTAQKQEADLQEYINQLSDSIPEAQILVSGYQVKHHKLKFPKNMSLIPDFETFLNLIEGVNRNKSAFSNMN